MAADALENLRRNPFVFDSLLLGAGGRRTVSKITPSFVHKVYKTAVSTNNGPVPPRIASCFFMPSKVADLVVFLIARSVADLH